METQIAIVGCGYVCDFYLATLTTHPALTVSGVYDRRPDRAHAVARMHGVEQVYDTLGDLLADRAIEVVVNLTPPDQHADVTRRALLAGRHVYTEKPLATSLDAAREVVELAESRGLLLASAPCCLLGSSVQALMRAIRDGSVGEPLLVYAELDDGAVPRMPYETWRSVSGAPWPYADEFAVGTVVHHASYQLSWMTAAFGPVVELTALSGQIGDWHAGLVYGTDFSCSVLRFESGTLGRVTCSMLAARNHRATVVGTLGQVAIQDCWDFWAPVTLRRLRTRRGPAHRIDDLDDLVTITSSAPRWQAHPYHDTHRMDFALGIADVARALRSGTQPRLSARHALHVLEVTLLMDNAADGIVARPATSFSPLPTAS